MTNDENMGKEGEMMIEKPLDTEEKRRFARVESYLPLQYKNLKRLKEPSVGGYTNDICEGGVKFKSSEFISLACRLLIEIDLPTVHKPVKVISKVAWIRKSPENKEYEIGNQFLEISKEDKSSITNFVNSLINTSI